MARLSRPLVPDGPIRLYYERLHAMHQAAGLPSIRQIQRATRSPQRPNGINPTTIHDAFVRPRVARWEVVQEIARSLGGDVKALARLWRLARDAQLSEADPADVADSGEAGTDASAALPVPRQLPPDVFGFTGRDGQLKRLDELLPGQADGDSTAAVITVIAGMAGIGKTSLAVHWGHRVRDRFPDGQLYLSLRGHGLDPPMRPIEALEILLRALGVPPEEIPVDVQSATGRFRSLLAGRRVLMLLDDAADAGQVRPLLPADPACMVMITSRDRMSTLVAREGAHRLALEALTSPEAHALLGRILGPDRTAAEPLAVEDLARACTFLPLALHLAAVDLVNRNAPTIAEYVTAFRTGDRLDALEVDGDEQSGIRRAFDMSYLALEPPSRHLFRLAGLVPGPHLTTAAAAAMTGAAVREAGRILERLAAAHLLHQRAPGQYGCHDLIREYAAGRAITEIPPQQREDALRRLFCWYLCSADRAAKTLYPHRLRVPLPPPPQQCPVAPSLTDDAGAMAWLDAERANLVAAVRLAARHGPWDVAWQLADTLRGYFWLGMHIQDWAETAHLSLHAAQADGDVRAQAAALLSIGDTDDRLNQRQQAVEHYTRALGLSRQAAWLEGQTAALAKLGTGLSESGRPQEAVDYYHQALELSHTTGSRYGQAVTLGALGRVSWQLGRIDEALTFLTDALNLFRALGARQGEGAAHDALGEVLHSCERFDEAAEHLDLALNIEREVGDRGTEAYTLLTLAALHCDTGRLAQAMELALAPLAFAREIGETRIEADALNTLGTVLRHTGRPGEAAASHRQTLDLTGKTGYRWTEARALIGLAAALADLGETAQARDHAQSALELCREAGYAMLETRAREILLAIGDSKAR